MRGGRRKTSSPSLSPVGDIRLFLKKQKGPEVETPHEGDRASKTPVQHAFMRAPPEELPGKTATIAAVLRHKPTAPRASVAPPVPALKVTPRTQSIVDGVREELLKAFSLNLPTENPWMRIYPYSGANEHGGEVPLGELAQTLEASYAALSGVQLAAFAKANRHIFTKQNLDGIMERGHWNMHVRHARLT